MSPTPSLVPSVLLKSPHELLLKHLWYHFCSIDSLVLVASRFCSGQKSQSYRTCDFDFLPVQPCFYLISVAETIIRTSVQRVKEEVAMFKFYSSLYLYVRISNMMPIQSEPLTLQHKVFKLFRTFHFESNLKTCFIKLLLSLFLRQHSIRTFCQLTSFKNEHGYTKVHHLKFNSIICYPVNVICHFSDRLTFFLFLPAITN